MDIQTFDNVWMFYISKDRDFPIKQSLRNFAFDICSSNFFNSYIIIIVKIESSKNLAKTTFSNLLVQIENIIVYLFDQVDLTVLGEHDVGWKIAYWLILIIQI